MTTKNQEEILALFKELSSSANGLSSAEAKSRLSRYGPNLIEVKSESLIHKIFKYFWGPIPWMIEAAAIVSLIVKHFTDFIFIAILLVFNGYVAFFQEFQAGNAIEALKKKLAVKSRVLRDKKWQELETLHLVPGDIIRLRLGDIVPADAILIEGDYLSIDQSSLTGESLPVTAQIGDTIFSGSIVQKGEMVALVIATGKESFFGKTIKLVANAKPISHFQKAVLQIGDFLIYLSLLLVVILIIVQLSRGDSFLQLLKFALILTIASIPVAMPAVLSVTMAVGALTLSKMKAIVTRLESIEEMAGIDALLCDKTGTLTQNKLTMGEPATYGKISKEELLSMAAFASKAEDMDAFDAAIISEVSQNQNFTQKRFVPFDPVSKRTEAEIIDSEGDNFTVSKGAPQIILALCGMEKETSKQIVEAIDTFAKKGYRTLGCARKQEGKNWQFLGLIPFYDPPREDSKQTIEQAKDHGIDVKMLTGDHLAIAREISTQLGIGNHIVDAARALQEGKIDIAEKVEKADGFAQVLPENKYIAVKALQTKGHIVGMTGDGVNDAPALKQADLGIAVSGATDAARSAASLVLTASGLSVIIRAVEEARRIFERMNSYAIYRITETIRIMIFMVLAILIYNFYPLTPLMIIMLALLNDIPIMTIAYDHTLLAKVPVKWDMYRVIFIAFVLGFIGVVETFLLVTIARIWLQLPLEELRSVIFLKLSVAGHLTLFIARTKGAFFLKPFPAPLLLVAIFATQALAALIVGFGIFVSPLSSVIIGFIWLYCLGWMFIEDAAKLLLYRHLALGHTYHQNFIGFVKGAFHPLFNRKK